ncbi:Plasmodium vivax Vir protein, putative [Plasmodium vivax]|uniref:Vir protein, putative n=1 Tax=Plasmodium vivax TaxID=5855 RepID=A0A1G4ECC9_PLAVI|nr:Plasmodium vivax Vir protein, putative [Plasmodium vivax]
MVCSRIKKRENYDFFEKVDIYIKYADGIKTTATESDVSADCTALLNGMYSSGNRVIIRNICEDFLKLYKSLSTSQEVHQNYKEFLNYWLNFRLSEGKHNENICVKQFYDDMESYCENTFGYVVSTNVFYDMDQDELDKMNILYNLYYNYYKIFKDDKIVCNEKSLCSQYTNHCLKYYGDGIIKCPTEKTDNFCRKLDQFRVKYEHLQKRTDISNNGYKPSDMESLPTHDQALYLQGSALQNLKDIVIWAMYIMGPTVGLSLIFLYFYKYTTFGKWICAKRNKKKIMRDSINQETYFLQYNLEDDIISCTKSPYNIRYHSSAYS